MADTIFAQATPPGRSGVAVFRVSGPRAFGSARALGAEGGPLRTAMLRRLSGPQGGGLLDLALVLRFAAPASFTGEDIVELHVHGGPGVCRAVAEALAALPGLREAEAGEFTRRALVNGKLDLAQVEGLADLLAAETVAQTRQALALLEGGLSAEAQRWRATLLRALALLEASIDFADEDLPQDVLSEAETLLTALLCDLDGQARGGGAAERIRAGFRVAIVGPPNVGKSTLLNAVAGREAAIASPVAGTTRDIIEVRTEIRGLPVTFADMAGLRRPEGAVEALGIERARSEAAAADLRVFLIDATADLAALEVAHQAGDRVVFAKADARRDGAAPAVSGLTGAGVRDLLEGIADELVGRTAGASLIGRERQRAAIGRAAEAVQRAVAALVATPPMAELAAADIQEAIRSLDFLLGKVNVEAVLDAIFAGFCIGK